MEKEVKTDEAKEKLEAKKEVLKKQIEHLQEEKVTICVWGVIVYDAGILIMSNGHLLMN